MWSARRGCLLGVGRGARCRGSEGGESGRGKICPAVMVGCGGE